MQIQNFKKFLENWSKVENSNTFLAFFITFSFLFLALISVEGVFVSFVPGDNSLHPLQVFETNVVFKIQKAFGIDVELVNETTLYYKTLKVEDSEGMKQGLNLIIISSCTGLHEIIFLSTLILAFRGVSLKSKLKWLGIFIPFLFIENLIRIATSQPLIAKFGFEWWESFHWYFWQYGQLIIVMVLFFLWFLFVASKEMEKKEQQFKTESKTAVKTNIETEEQLPENSPPLQDEKQIDLTEKEKKNFEIAIFVVGVLMFVWAYILSELMKIQVFELHLITVFVIVGFYLGKELL